MSRTICWFSCGAASAVATALTLASNPEALVVRNVVREEHPDNDRFAADCEKWFGKEIINTMSDRYNGSIYEVFEQRKYIAGIHGAPCTFELKKNVRERFQRPDDVHVFGFTAEEQGRFDRLLDANGSLQVEAPLIDAGMTHADCLALLDRRGIELPAMYRLGYRNNNCIGCVKGGAGYWNKIRSDFPEVFERMAALEERYGARLVKQGGERIPLRDLHPDTGDYQAEAMVDCGIFCELADMEIGERVA